MRLYILILFVLFSFSVSGQHMLLAGGEEESTGGGIPTGDLILHLDAGDPSSYPGTGTDWFDLSPAGNDATLFGSIYSSSEGGYINTQQSGYATVPNFVETNLGLTACVWFNARAYQIIFAGEYYIFPLAKRFIGSYDNWHIANVLLTDGITTHSVGYAWDASGGPIAYTRGNIINTNLFSLNNWVFQCVCTDGTSGSDISVYVDNIIASNEVLTADRGLSTQILNIARVSNNNLGDMYVSQVFVYNRKLSSQELTDLYNATNRY